ncbi:MAG TPA: BrnT family toxin [Stellaceae bacterium]|nr:BrnT family toxin [Stellaceae bacterium]
MDSEWDEAKRQANILKHGVDLVDAIEIFAGEFIEAEDRRRDYGERRYRVVGQLGEKIIQIAYTWRGERGRIISARRAGRK